MRESLEQQAVIKWARFNRQQWPCLERLLSIPNGAHTTPKNRARLVREGLIAGVSDLFLPHASKGHHGLWIEMKKVGGHVDEEQVAWLLAMKSEGYEVSVCYSWESAVQIIKDYLADGTAAAV